jgi:2-succinyl-5-enolpyruvyl-6-hydroxy-3-cyclohexene-1-carboxylate synthase
MKTTSSPQNHTESHAAALVGSLAHGGVRHVVVSPGSRSTPMVLAFAALDSVTSHVVLDERVAGFVALGLARSTNTPVALVCTSGTAAAHYLPAVIEASASNIPLLLLTADRPVEKQHAGAPQTVSQSQLFQSHVRWMVDVGAPLPAQANRWVRTVAAQAVDRATCTPAGPVHLNVAYRKPLWSEGCQPTPVRPARVLRSVTSDALGRFRGRGVVVCGPQSGSDSAAVAVISRTLGWPVIAEPAANVEPGLETLIRSADALLRDPETATRLVPECVLRLGRVPTSKAVQQWLELHALNRTILLDPQGDWHDPAHLSDLLLAVPSESLSAALVSSSAGSVDDTWLSMWQDLDRTAAQALGAACAIGCWEGAVARAVMEGLPEGAALHVASSMPIRDLDSFAPHRERALLVTANRGANGIDGTISSVLGASLAHPTRPLVALLGDLAFLHDLSGLLAAVQAGIRATIVVVDNGGGGIFGMLPIAAHPSAFQRFFLTPQRADIAALSTAAGAHFEEAADPAALQQALALDLERDGVGVLCVRIDREENEERHQAAWAAVRDAVAEEGLWR